MSSSQSTNAHEISPGNGYHTGRAVVVATNSAITLATTSIPNNQVSNNGECIDGKECRVALDYESHGGERDTSRSTCMTELCRGYHSRELVASGSRDPQYVSEHGFFPCPWLQVT
ncbi:hypothetical protein BDW69DRAFT_39457 [Aspergillus filifer]